MDTLETQKQTILDLFFPYFCLLCGTEVGAAPNYLCHGCKTKLLRPPGPSCRLCTAPLDGNETKDVCPSCRRRKIKHPYKAAYAPAIYNNTQTRQLLTLMKGSKKKVLLAPMAEIMTGFAERFISDINDYDLIVPIPMHWTKLALRGFNQAQELARIIGGKLLMPTAQDIISRRMFSHAQKSLPEEQRDINALAAFKPGKNINQVKDKNILLIDDILTTGQTAAHCSRILIDAGAGKISVLVFAGTQEQSKS